MSCAYCDKPGHNRRTCTATSSEQSRRAIRVKKTQANAAKLRGGYARMKARLAELEAEVQRRWITAAPRRESTDY